MKFCLRGSIDLRSLRDHPATMSSGQSSLRKASNKAIDNCGDDSAGSITSALDQLRSDKKTPVFLKTLLGHILEAQDRFAEFLAKNQELHERICSLQDENAKLRRELYEVQTKHSPVSNAQENGVKPSCDCFDEKERLRSIVISGVSEATSPSSIDRVRSDYDVVEQIFNHLEIECLPQAVYRLGKPRDDRSRLLKVILPSTSYQKLVLRRAPRLRSFSSRGVFIRPSLTKEQRERNREARMTQPSLSRVAPNSQSVHPNNSSVN